MIENRHAEIARAIHRVAREMPETAIPCTTTARQGDLLLTRIRDVNKDDGPFIQPDPAGDPLIVGSHGEHRLMTDGTYSIHRNDVALGDFRAEGVFTLAGDGYVVHTDEPHARHKTVALCPGVWGYATTTELRGEELVNAKD